MAIVVATLGAVGAPGKAAAPAPSPKSSATPGPRPTPRKAPGDEYFGRMKLSYLGINNAFKDQAVRAGAFTTNDSVISALRDADDALQDWRRKYPHDPQLARSYFLASQAYAKVYTKEFQDKAFGYMTLLVVKYPNTYFGKQEKTNLAIGFTEHYYAPPQPCPTVVPPTPTAVSSRRGAPVPSPTPTPTSTPTPEPTPTPAPGQPKVVLLFQACIPQTPR